MSKDAKIAVKKGNSGKWEYTVTLHGIEAACGGFETQSAVRAAADAEAKHMAAVLG
jgi:hypothetical protein